MQTTITEQQYIDLKNTIYFLLRETDKLQSSFCEYVAIESVKKWVKYNEIEVKD